MARVSIVVRGCIFFLCSLPALSGSYPNELNADSMIRDSNPRIEAEELLEPRRYIREKPAVKYPSTEERLEADGFLKDRQAQSSLEHDLTNKLKAIYEHYYELTDKLEQAEGHTRELTRQLTQADLELANYKEYKHHLINRLKKTEMFLTVLLKKSQNDIEEHEIDLYSKLEEKPTGIQRPNEDKVVKVMPSSDLTTEISSAEVGKVNDTESGDSTYLGDPSGYKNMKSEPNTLNHSTQTTYNGSTKENVLAQIGFNFLRKKPIKVEPHEALVLRSGLFDDLKNDVTVFPSGPVVKNVTVVLRASSKRKDVMGASLADGDFGDDFDKMGLRVVDSDSNERRHPNYQYVMTARWASAGSPGLPGMPGTKGISGPTGPAGPTGAPGLAGGAGQKGEPGSGVAGVDGVNGVAGVPGAPGFPGPSGANGAQGPVGEKGALGTHLGPMGAKGAKGAVGDPPDLVPTGPSGPTGPTGPPGPPGG